MTRMRELAVGGTNKMGTGLQLAQIVLKTYYTIQQVITEEEKSGDESFNWRHFMCADSFDWAVVFDSLIQQLNYHKINQFYKSMGISWISEDADSSRTVGGVNGEVSKTRQSRSQSSFQLSQRAQIFFQTFFDFWSFSSSSPQKAPVLTSRDKKSGFIS